MRRHERTAIYEPRPYAGRSAVLATMHRKEEAIAPALSATLGLVVVPAAGDRKSTRLNSSHT